MKSLASNFGHLQFHDEQVRRLGMLAERYFAEDPKKTSLERFRDFPVPMAPLPEPQEIFRRVEDLFAFADRSEARLATAQKTVERLTPSILAKAFRGELVPQDPNDEPALALLARLRSQPVAKPAKATRKTRK
jgi:type I restriction enzyme S subunit